MGGTTRLEEAGADRVAREVVSPFAPPELALRSLAHEAASRVAIVKAMDPLRACMSRRLTDRA